MTRGTIYPCPAPWKISPSGSFLKVVQEEEVHPIFVEASVNCLAQDTDVLEPARVQLEFERGLRMASHGFGADEYFMPERTFDVAALEALDRARGQEPPKVRWRRLGFAESSGTYEVHGSTQADQPIGAPWRHFVVEGTELWIEIVARSCKWTFIDRAGQPIGPGGELKG